MSYEMNSALDSLEFKLVNDFRTDWHDNLALEYLLARIPRMYAEHRREILALRDLILTGSGEDETLPLLVIDKLRGLLESEPLPEVTRIDSPQNMREVAAELGVRGDWHEPDESEVSVITTNGSFDNAGGYAERHVIFLQEGIPVAEVNLATLCSWACQAPDENGAS